jgi:hypothetical protein
MGRLSHPRTRTALCVGPAAGDRPAFRRAAHAELSDDTGLEEERRGEPGVGLPRGKRHEVLADREQVDPPEKNHLAAVEARRADQTALGVSRALREVRDGARRGLAESEP